jgi:methyl coenzyme M reductase gamma subunit
LTIGSERIILASAQSSTEAIVAAKQTRRSISVRGTTYDNLRQYCVEQDISMSEVVEEQIARLLERPSTAGRPAPVPYEKVVAPRVARAPKGDYRTIRF